METANDSPKKPGDIGYGPDGGLILYGYMPEGYISASEEPDPPPGVGDVSEGFGAARPGRQA